MLISITYFVSLNNVAKQTLYLKVSVIYISLFLNFASQILTGDQLVLSKIKSYESELLELLFLLDFLFELCLTNFHHRATPNFIKYLKLSLYIFITISICQSILYRRRPRNRYRSFFIQMFCPISNSAIFLLSRYLYSLDCKECIP